MVRGASIAVTIVAGSDATFGSRRTGAATAVTRAELALLPDRGIRDTAYRREAGALATRLAGKR